MAKSVQANEDWLGRVQGAVDGLRYGTVQIVVHDGRVVQIERTERFRYENATERQKNVPPQTAK